MKEDTVATRLLNFDIDVYINPIIPPSPLGSLPIAVSRFLGYRRDKGDGPLNDGYHITKWIWAFIGGFCGIALIEAVNRLSPAIQSLSPPLVIASFGAAAILEYNAIESPLAQPRNLILSHVLAAAVGVGVTKLFALLPPAQYNDLQWLAGALVVGATSFLMSATKTVHPPAGATALLAATSPEVIPLGWYLVPLVLLAAVLMLASACILNNIQRQFPLYWWTPVDLREARRNGKADDIEKASEARRMERKDAANADSTTTLGSYSSRDGSDAKIGEESEEKALDASEHEIKITGNEIIIPDWLEINDFKKELLELLRQDLRQHKEAGDT